MKWIYVKLNLFYVNLNDFMSNVFYCGKRLLTSPSSPCWPCGPGGPRLPGGPEGPGGPGSPLMAITSA